MTSWTAHFLSVCIAMHMHEQMGEEIIKGNNFFFFFWSFLIHCSSWEII